MQERGGFGDGPCGIGGGAFDQQRFGCDADGEEAARRRLANGIGQP